MKAGSALFNGLLLLLVALGVRDVFFVYERNRCSMTYMYEYPEYQKIKLPKKSARLFPAYELHLYGEGIYAEKNKQLNALNGIPVLFLPGNAGSYKQARSFGSIALRKSENIDYRYHFDVFTVNFNEELVAFYGGSLKRQTEFVNVCIKTILRLYKNQEFPPQSVIIIGHSMGGLIARALFTLKTFKPQLINLIITQATPHVMPVLTIDSYLTDFYAMVNHYWILNAKELQNVTILSVAGGFRDFQVRSGLAVLPASDLYASALSVVSTSVPRTWASTDHLSIVWCKELILATARALFDLIDEDTKQIINRPEKKMSVLNHHFVRHPAKQYESSYETIASVPVSSTWVFIEARNWKHSVAVECSETYFAFPLLNKRNIHSHFHCRSTHLNTQSWIFGCKEGSTKCLNIEDLSWNSELLLSAKTVTLKLDSFPNTTHFVIYQPRINNTEFSVECEFLKEELKTQQLPVTHALSFGFSSSHIQINSSGLLHFIQLQGFSKIYQAFDIFIEKSCKEPKENTPNMFRLHVPWSHEDIIRTSSNDAPVQLFAKLHEPQSQNDSRMVTLMLYTSQDCHYEITVYTSFLQMLGQMIRFHGASLPVYIVSNLLLAYGAHLYFLSSKGHCLEFDASMDMAAKPYKVDPIVNICRFLLGYDWFKNIWDNLMLPHLDSSELYSLGLLFPLASLFLFMFGTGVAYWSGTFFKSIIGLMAAIWRTVKRNTNAPEKSSSFTYNALVEAILYSLVSWKTCGAFGILLVFVRYLVKVVKMQSELWRSLPSNNGVSRQTTNTEDLSSEPSTESDSSTEMDSEDLVLTSQQAEDSDLMTTSDSLKMHITIINLLLWLTLLVLPSFIYWVKNIRYNIQLNPDPIRLLAVPLIFSVVILMNANVVSMKSSKLLKTAARLQLPFSIFIVAFGTLHLYRVSYFIVLSLSIHALTCFF